MFGSLVSAKKNISKDKINSNIKITSSNEQKKSIQKDNHNYNSIKWLTGC